MNEKFEIKKPVDPEEAAMHLEVMAFLLSDLLDSAPPNWDSNLDRTKVEKCRREVLNEWNDEEICEYLEDKQQLFVTSERTRAVVDVVEGKIKPIFDEDEEEDDEAFDER